MRTKYQVICGNLGQVYQGNNKREALREFSAYVKLSKDNYGRVAGEDVYLFADGEPVKEFFGTYTIRENQA